MHHQTTHIHCCYMYILQLTCGFKTCNFRCAYTILCFHAYRRRAYLTNHWSTLNMYWLRSQALKMAVHCGMRSTVSRDCTTPSTAMQRNTRRPGMVLTSTVLPIPTYRNIRSSLQGLKYQVSDNLPFQAATVCTVKFFYL